MKNLLFAAALLLNILVFSSCNKDKDDSPGNGDYFMKFTINGTTEEYKGNTAFEYSDDGHQLTLVALKDALSVDNDMSIVLSSPDAFKTGVHYTEQENSANFSAAFLSYFDNAGDLYTSLGPTLATDAHVDVVLTDINDNYIKGTFSGNLYDEAFSTPTHTVTNGSFYIKKK